MAEKVATWPELYGCDGIDLDIEDGAGDAKGAGPNMIHFIRKLRELNPKMIIGQPTYGFPAVRSISISIWQKYSYRYISHKHNYTQFNFLSFRYVPKSTSSMHPGMKRATIKILRILLVLWCMKGLIL